MVLRPSVCADYSKYHNAAGHVSSGLSLFEQHDGRSSFFLLYYPKGVSTGVWLASPFSKTAVMDVMVLGLRFSANYSKTHETKACLPRHSSALLIHIYPSFSIKFDLVETSKNPMHDWLCAL